MRDAHPIACFFFKYCDGKLVDEMLNEAGNTFAEHYYGDDGLYLDDYANGFGELNVCRKRGSS